LAPVLRLLPPEEITGLEEEGLAVALVETDDDPDEVSIDEVDVEVLVAVAADNTDSSLA
jgi:hypothetical protein